MLTTCKERIICEHMKHNTRCACTGRKPLDASKSRIQIEEVRSGKATSNLEKYQEFPKTQPTS